MSFRLGLFLVLIIGLAACLGAFILTPVYLPVPRAEPGGIAIPYNPPLEE